MIHKKLLEFQRQGITLEKDGVNPHFKNRYSTLNEVLSKVKGPLNKLGVVVIQNPRENGLDTVLLDTEDATLVMGTTPYMGVVDMQKLGGAITYARRYALIAMLGLEDEDDDGNSASRGNSGASKGVVGQTDEPFKGNNDFDI